MTHGPHRFGRSLLLAVTGSILAVPLAISAQPAPTPQAGQAATQPQHEAPKWPDFNQTIKDMTPMPGLFTLYRYKAEDNSKDQTKILCVIPRSLLKQDLLLATSISRGPMAGYQWDDYLIRFEMQGKLVVIRVPDARFVTDPKQPVNDAVSRTYNDAFLTALPIVTFTPGGDPVVELGGPLLAPLVNLPAPSGPGAAFSPRREMSTFDKVKVFPDNVLIDADIALAGRTGAGMSVGITYSFRRLPQAGQGGFSPRIADERVGYFTTVRQDWGMKWSERENIVRYINRWDVRKKDPSLELSPPDKPIVFVIEKTVPLQWRKYVAEGIAEWNKAYEKLGIVGAIVVQQQTDDNEFANVDPEDARYNFIRWIVTGRGFAMGPSRADPRTGQILDADIIFDDSMLRFYFREFDTFGPGQVAALMGPGFTQFLVDHPEFIPQGMTVDQVKDAARSLTSNYMGTELLHEASPVVAGQTVESPLVSKRLAPARTECNYAVGLQRELALANLAVASTGKKIPDKFIGDVIREIVAHEVGHTLGLRHNFKASSWLSESEIKRRRDTTDEPLVASVMDYNPVVYFAGDDISKMRHLQTPCIGPYDYWAIEYGYKPADKGSDEKSMLQQIAGQCTKREYGYATDEDTVGLQSVDPLVNRFDLSDDPIAWAKSRTTLSDQLMKNIKTWAVKGNEPNYYLRSTYL
ncbi:MAG TPA: zinc-dependent metalloprotease, partial [Tepidisphaeraceae bacterium]